MRLRSISQLVSTYVISQNYCQTQYFHSYTELFATLHDITYFMPFDGCQTNFLLRNDLSIQYLQLESSTHRLAFVNSAYTLVKGFGFDGLDLAWEFPENKPKKIRSSLGSIWHSVKKTVGGTTLLDENADDHREQFVGLVRELKNAFRAENLLVTMTVLPNVNSTGKEMVTVTFTSYIYHFFQLFRLIFE